MKKKITAVATDCRTCKKPLRAFALYCHRCGGAELHILSGKALIRCLRCGLVHDAPGPIALSAMRRARVTRHP